MNLGSNLLSKKDFENGFKEYSWRIYFDELLDIDTKKNKKTTQSTKFEDNYV